MKSKKDHALQNLHLYLSVPQNHLRGIKDGEVQKPPECQDEFLSVSFIHCKLQWEAHISLFSAPLLWEHCEYVKNLESRSTKVPLFTNGLSVCLVTEFDTFQKDQRPQYSDKDNMSGYMVTFMSRISHSTDPQDQNRDHDLAFCKELPWWQDEGGALSPT